MKKIIDFFKKSPVKNEVVDITNRVTKATKIYTFEELVELSVHYNGFKREEAVRMLGCTGDPRALTPVLTRLNDWVLEVRVVAKEAFIKLLTEENYNHVLMILDRIYHLSKCSRAEHRSLIESVDRYLIECSDSSLIIQGVNSPDKFVARACLSLVISNNLLPKKELVELGFKNKDVIVRLRCSSLLSDLSLEEQKVLLEIAIKDKFMPIRREAFQLILDINNDDYNIELAQSLLFDGHSRIRLNAINFLKNKEVNVSDDYLPALISSKVAHIKLAIWAIGYLSLKEHSNEIKLQLASNNPSIRKQALITLYKLNDEFMRETLLDALFDEAASVCKIAAKYLAKAEFSITLDDLLLIIMKVKTKQSYLTCLFLSRHINKWDRLIFILYCFSKDLDKTNNAILQEESHDWTDCFNKTGTQPSKEQLNELLSTYRTHKVYFSKALLNILSFTFKSNGMRIDA